MQKPTFQKIKQIIKYFFLSPIDKVIISPIKRLYSKYSYRGKIPLHWFNFHLNWGDAINPILVGFLSGKKVKLQQSRGCDRYLAIGSVLSMADNRTEVWGSGFRDHTERLELKPKKVHAVRGPLTRGILLESGIDCPEIFGDPALLLPFFYNPKIVKKYRIGIIPHYIDKDHPWIIEQMKSPDVLIIDVQGDIFEFVRMVNSCRVIVSSSLHGLICADSYNIPNVWIKLSNNTDAIGGDFKFHDYFLSVNNCIPQCIKVSNKTQIAEIISSTAVNLKDIDLKKLVLSCPFLDEKIRVQLEKGFPINEVFAVNLISINN